jgi:hypothetical protein
MEPTLGLPALFPPEELDDDSEAFETEFVVPPCPPPELSFGFVFPSETLCP